MRHLARGDTKTIAMTLDLCGGGTTTTTEQKDATVGTVRGKENLEDGHDHHIREITDQDQETGSGTGTGEGTEAGTEKGGTGSTTSAATMGKSGMKM